MIGFRDTIMNNDVISHLVICKPLEKIAERRDTRVWSYINIFGLATSNFKNLLASRASAWILGWSDTQASLFNLQFRFSLLLIAMFISSHGFSTSWDQQCRWSEPLKLYRVNIMLYLTICYFPRPWALITPPLSKGSHWNLIDKNDKVFRYQFPHVRCTTQYTCGSCTIVQLHIEAHSSCPSILDWSICIVQSLLVTREKKPKCHTLDLFR